MISVHINQLIAVSKSTLGREEGREGERRKGERKEGRRKICVHPCVCVIKYTETTLYKNE